MAVRIMLVSLAGAGPGNAGRIIVRIGSDLATMAYGQEGGPRMDPHNGLPRACLCGSLWFAHIYGLPASGNIIKQ